MRQLGITTTLMILQFGIAARADVTRTATFENFTAGQVFKPSFTDPDSGIIFSNSTGATQNFVINSGISAFGGNYLGSYGIGPSWAYQFGFIGTLPTPASTVSMDVSASGIYNDRYISLEAFDQNNNLLGEVSGPDSTQDPFTLQISLGKYQISYFKTIAVGVPAAYDNISNTSNVPEPASLLIIGGVITLCARRRGSRGPGC